MDPPLHQQQIVLSSGNDPPLTHANIKSGRAAILKIESHAPEISMAMCVITSSVAAGLMAQPIYQGRADMALFVYTYLVQLSY